MNDQTLPWYRQLARRRFALAALALVCLGLIAATSILFSAKSRAQEAANRAKCHKTLKALGHAIYLYANENHWVCPSKIEDLMLSQDIGSEIFICPSSDDTPATGATPLERAASLASPGHSSYLYAGNSKTGLNDPNTVLMYEPLKNHRDGFHAVFGDLHVEFITGPAAPQIEAELRSGKNPPPSHLPIPLPATRPRELPTIHRWPSGRYLQ